jgi:hypothetical protein
MLWTFAYVFCNLHRLIRERVASAAHRFCWLSILVFILAKILSLFALVFSPLLSCGFVKNLWILVVWVLLGIDLWGDKLFGSLRMSSRYNSWLWSELIPFWVRWRKPQQNPKSECIFKYVIVLQIQLSSKFVETMENTFFKVCIKFHLNRNLFGSVSHLRTEFRAVEISTS